MKITKYLHSCLLVEEGGKTLLIDPGSYTAQEKALTPDSLTKLDYLLITHEHLDHMSIPFIRALHKRFPYMKIMSNAAVVAHLNDHEMKAFGASDHAVSITTVTHERIFDLKAPKNAVFDIFDKLTHPGDYMGFTASKEILALPLIGPSWMITQAAEKALAVKPKYVLPIHDFHFKDDLRKHYYDRLEKFFGAHNITFKKLVTGETVKI